MPNTETETQNSFIGGLYTFKEFPYDDHICATLENGHPQEAARAFLNAIVEGDKFIGEFCDKFFRANDDIVLRHDKVTKEWKDTKQDYYRYIIIKPSAHPELRIIVESPKKALVFEGKLVDFINQYAIPEREFLPVFDYRGRIWTTPRLLKLFDENLEIIAREATSMSGSGWNKQALLAAEELAEMLNLDVLSHLKSIRTWIDTWRSNPNHDVSILKELINSIEEATIQSVPG